MAISLNYKALLFTLTFFALIFCEEKPKEIVTQAKKEKQPQLDLGKTRVELGRNLTKLGVKVTKAGKTLHKQGTRKIGIVKLGIYSKTASSFDILLELRDKNNKLAARSKLQLNNVAEETKDYVFIFTDEKAYKSARKMRLLKI